MFKVYARYLVDESDCPISKDRSFDHTGELLFFDDTSTDEKLILIEPTLQLSDSTAGSFEFTLPTSNIAYGWIGKMDTEIRVFQNDIEIWRGRPTEEEIDFNNRKRYTCEGALAYLNDTIIPPKEYATHDVYNSFDLNHLIRELIDNHNSQLGRFVNDQQYEMYPGINKFFHVRSVQVHNDKSNSEFINNESYVNAFGKTLDAINNLCKEFDAHIRVDYENDQIYLTVLADLEHSVGASQEINFGENLLDFTKNFDMTDLCTVVVPLGNLPSDFKAKGDQLIANGTVVNSKFQNTFAGELLHDLIPGKWVDGFELLNINQFYTIEDIQVTPGKKYSVTSALPNGMVALSYVDSNNNYISNVKHDGARNQNHASWVLKVHTVPSNCSALSVCSYGGYPSIVITTPETNPEEKRQQREIKVPEGKSFEDYVKDDSELYRQVVENCGEVYDETQSSSIPSFDDIADYDPETDTYTYNDDVADNRKRYVLYHISPTIDFGSATYSPGAFICDRDLICHNLHVDTVRLDCSRRTVNGKVVDDDRKFFFSGRLDYNFFVYVVTDANGSILESKNSTETSDPNQHTTYDEEQITISDPNAKWLYICAEAGTLQVWEYNYLYDLANMKLTVEEVNNGSMYVMNTNAVNTHGWIAKTIEFEVTDKQTLLSKAEQYLQEVQFNGLQMDVTALDLSYINKSLRPFHMYESVHCISSPHGLNKWFPVTAIDMPLDKPDSVSYTLGEQKEHEYTEATNDIVADLIEKLNMLPTRESVLKEAKENATGIMKQYCHGYVTIVEDDPRFGSCIYISDSEDYLNSKCQWLWNLNGLGYSNDGGSTFGLAMTMDGSIVADYITTGTMSADRIRTGLLIDIEGHNYWNLETGEIALGLNLKTTKIDDASDYYGGDSSYFASDNGVELGSWIYDHTNHEYNFNTVFGSGTNLVDGIYSYVGYVTDPNTGQVVQETFYNPRTSRNETRDKKYYWLYISASIISTGLLKSRNGRLWFDLDTGSLWCAGVDKLGLNNRGEVIYNSGQSSGTAMGTTVPTEIDKHIRFEEGAILGYSNAQFSPTYKQYTVRGDYVSKVDSDGNAATDFSNATWTDSSGNKYSRFDIINTGNIGGGTLEGFIDLVTTYPDGNNNNAYDLVIAGSNRVHINFGNKILIGKASNLMDADPKILITGEHNGTTGHVSIGDPDEIEERVDLEVYGNTQIGHKYSTQGGTISQDDPNAPDRTEADKYKGDLTVYGNTTLGRNYYTDEKEEQQSTVVNSPTVQVAADGKHLEVVNTSVMSNSLETEQVTKRKYYDDIYFYGNVHFQSEFDTTTIPKTEVANGLCSGTTFDEAKGFWDNSWKYLNGVTNDTANKINSSDTTNDGENAIDGTLIVKGRTQFVGNTVSISGGRFIIGDRSSGSFTSLFSNPSTMNLNKRYEDVGNNKPYDIFKTRFTVEGKSLFFGDVAQLSGDVVLSNITVKDTSSVVILNGDFNPDPYANLNARINETILYFRSAYSFISNRSLEVFESTINSSTNESNLYERNVLYLDKDTYLSGKLGYNGTNTTLGLFIDTTIPKDMDGNTRSTNSADGPTKVTIRGTLQIQGHISNLVPKRYPINATIYQSGRINARCLDITGIGSDAIDNSTTNYTTIVEEGQAAAKSFAVYDSGDYIGDTERFMRAKLNKSALIFYGKKGGSVVDILNIEGYSGTIYANKYCLRAYNENNNYAVVNQQVLAAEYDSITQAYKSKLTLYNGSYSAELSSEGRTLYSNSSVSYGHALKISTHMVGLSIDLVAPVDQENGSYIRKTMGRETGTLYASNVRVYARNGSGAYSERANITTDGYVHAVGYQLRYFKDSGATIVDRQTLLASSNTNSNYVTLRLWRDVANGSAINSFTSDIYSDPRSVFNSGSSVLYNLVNVGSGLSASFIDILNRSVNGQVSLTGNAEGNIYAYGVNVYGTVNSIFQRTIALNSNGMLNARSMIIADGGTITLGGTAIVEYNAVANFKGLKIDSTSVIDSSRNVSNIHSITASCLRLNSSGDIVRDSLGNAVYDNRVFISDRGDVSARNLTVDKDISCTGSISASTMSINSLVANQTIGALKYVVNGVQRIDENGNCTFSIVNAASVNVNGVQRIDGNGNLRGLSLWVNGVQRIDSDGKATLYTVSATSVSADNIYASSNLRCYDPLSLNSVEYGLNYTGVLTYSSLNQVSDIRLKKEVKEYNKNALNIVNNIKVKSFKWKNNDVKVEAGFIADEVEEQNTNPSDDNTVQDLVSIGEDGYKCINYNEMVAVLWKAVQELSAEVKELKLELQEARNAKH